MLRRRPGYHPGALAPDRAMMAGVTGTKMVNGSRDGGLGVESAGTIDPLRHRMMSDCVGDAPSR